MLILGIETSCDETSAAVVEDGTRVHSNIIASSLKDFQNTGGVIPEQAARKQVECILPVVTAALEEANCTMNEIDAIAVTKGPGLLVSLLVGTTVARTLASIWKKPLIGVHHTLGHLCSIALREKSQIQSTKSQKIVSNLEFDACDVTSTSGHQDSSPVLTLSASGGHTDLWLRTSYTQGKLLGRTRDDAAGEAFDKGAALLGLPYPGGPSIQKAGAEGDPKAYEFPLPLTDDGSLDFSFSGLKTALKNLVENIANPESDIANIAASYEYAICRHLIHKIKRAMEEYTDVEEIHLVGGCSANARLRQMLTEALPEKMVRYPEKIPYCTDNAAMIAAGAYCMFKEQGEEVYQPFETGASISLAEALTNAAKKR